MKTNRILLLILIVLISSCSGGFYTLRKASIQNPSQQQGKDVESLTIEDLPYLDINVIPRLNRLQSPEFQAKRNGTIEYLVIYVSFNHKALGGEVKIPIYHLNLKNGNLKVYNSYRIVNKFPLIQDARFNSFLSFNTIAIEKSYANSVVEVLDQIEQSDNAITQAITSSGPASSVISAISFGTELLDKFSKKSQYNFEQNIAILSPDKPELNRAYIIVPTSRNATVPKEIDSLISRTTYSISPDVNGDLYVMNGTDKLDFEFPYIILNYSLSEHVFDPELNVITDLTSLALIDKDKIGKLDSRVKTAERKLLLPDEELNEYLSLDQLAYESGLITRLRLLVEMKKSALLMRNSKDSTEKANNSLNFLNRYYQYKTELSILDTSSSLYTSHFKSDYENVDEAVEKVFNASIVRSAEILLLVDAISEVNDGQVNISNASETNSILNKLGYYENIVKAYKWAEKSSIVSRARINKNLIEGNIYETIFRNDVEKLNLENCSSNAVSIVTKLNPMLVDYSNCQMCISNTTNGIKLHDQKCESLLGELKSEILDIGITLKNSMSTSKFEYQAILSEREFDNSNMDNLDGLINRLESELEKIPSLKTVKSARTKKQLFLSIKSDFEMLKNDINEDIKAIQKQIELEQEIVEKKDQLKSELYELLEKLDSDHLNVYLIQSDETSIDQNYTKKIQALNELINQEINTIEELYNISDINSYKSRKQEFMELKKKIEQE